MIDFYLKFPDETTAQSVLYTVTPQVTDQDGNVVEEESTKANFINIDVLGTLYSTPVEGEEPVALDGYHVNVRALDGEDTTELEQYAVVPQFPRRIWG